VGLGPLAQLVEQRCEIPWVLVQVQGGATRLPSKGAVVSFQSDPRRGLGIGFALWFAFCAIISLGTLGIGIWAVIALVNWVTTK
jgi:hypothetical protein